MRFSPCSRHFTILLEWQWHSDAGAIEDAKLGELRTWRALIQRLAIQQEPQIKLEKELNTRIFITYDYKYAWPYSIED